MGVPRNPHSPEKLNIHSSNTVVVGFVSALTTIQVLMVVAVRLVDLRNLMIHIRHPTVLSPRNGFEFALR